MKRILQILVAVLVVQLILTAITTITNKRDLGAFVSNEKLLAIDFAAVDQITLEQADKPALHLQKKGGRWSLSDRGDFPVSHFKLDKAIKQLLSVNKSWPVATTESAAKHFRVAENTFERKLTFSKGDTVINTLLLGSSPGFKKIHARVAGANEIYPIIYSAFEANTDPDAWADKDYLKLTGHPIVRVTLANALVLQGNGEQMDVAGLTEIEESNQEKVESVMQSLAGLSFNSVLGTEIKPEYNQDKPILEYTLELKTGDSISYRFSKLGDSDNLVLKTSSHPYFFKVMPATISSIQTASRQTLVQNKSVPIDNDHQALTPDPPALSSPSQ